MPVDPFPTVPDGQPVVLSPAVYRRMVSMLLALADPSVAGARHFGVDANGRLSLVIDPGGTPGVLLVKITGTLDDDDSGGSGGDSGIEWNGIPGQNVHPGDVLPYRVYSGRVCDKATTHGNVFTFSLPDYDSSGDSGGSGGESPHVWLVNTAEPGVGSQVQTPYANHTLTIGSYCWALPTGGTASDGRAVYTLMQMEDPPTDQYQVRTPIDPTLKPVWTRPRFSSSGPTGEGGGSTGYPASAGLDPEAAGDSG